MSDEAASSLFVHTFEPKKSTGKKDVRKPLVTFNVTKFAYSNTLTEEKDKETTPAGRTVIEKVPFKPSKTRGTA